MVLKWCIWERSNFWVLEPCFLDLVLHLWKKVKHIDHWHTLLGKYYFSFFISSTLSNGVFCAQEALYFLRHLNQKWSLMVVFAWHVQGPEFACSHYMVPQSLSSMAWLTPWPLSSLSTTFQKHCLILPISRGSQKWPWHPLVLAQINITFIKTSWWTEYQKTN